MNRIIDARSFRILMFFHLLSCIIFYTARSIVISHRFEQKNRTLSHIANKSTQETSLLTSIVASDRSSTSKDDTAPSSFPPRMAPPKKQLSPQKEDDQVIIEEVVDEVVAAAGDVVSPKKKRLCRHPGCNKVIKSQGHCQRHGARAKRCKVEGCVKQAQGTHDGMCKRHWKAVHFPSAPAEPKEQPPPPEGESIYDSVLPSSISYRPVGHKKVIPEDETAETEHKDPLDPPSAPEGVQVMPLVAFLQEGRSKEAGWHRTAERRSRGMFLHASLSSQLEPWERQLALVEILLLSGGTPYANFKDLAHAWGREKGFHNLLASSVCERRGEVDRKKRSDAGRSLTEEEREAFRGRLKKTKTTAKHEDDDEIAVLTATEELVSAQIPEDVGLAEV